MAEDQLDAITRTNLVNTVLKRNGLVVVVPVRGLITVYLRSWPEKGCCLLALQRKYKANFHSYSKDLSNIIY